MRGTHMLGYLAGEPELLLRSTERNKLCPAPYYQEGQQHQTNIKLINIKKRGDEKMNIAMIDTLVAMIDVKNYEDSACILLKKLEAKKKEAKQNTANNISEKTDIQIGTKTFEILSNGSRGYAYILHNDEYEIKLSQFRSKNKDFFPIFIKVKSECLWSKGVEKSWSDILYWIEENIGKIETNKLSRLDPCCHTDELTLTIADFETFKGRFFDDNMRRHRRKVNAIEIGSRTSNNVYCRIYDKILEVKTKKKKYWFYDIWEKYGMNCENIYNVEFQLNRDFFKEMQIESVEDVFKRLRNIWDYCTKEWLVKVNLDNVRMERCSTDETWLRIQEAFSNYQGIGMISRTRQLEADAEALLPGTIGNITSYAARLGNTDIEQVIETVKNRGSKYLASKQQDYSKAINKKMSLIKQPEVQSI